MKVLVGAYACRPGWGSEPGVGWNWVREISRFADVHVLTREPNRGFIEPVIERAPLRSVTWHYVPVLPGLSEQNPLQYYLWQKRMLGHARSLHQDLHFDLCHHITYCIHWMPASLADLGIPFVWGPVGGGEQPDPKLVHDLAIGARAKNILRDRTQRFFERNRRVRATAAKAAIAFGTTEHTARRLRFLGAKDVRVMPSVGLPPEDFDRLASIPIRRPGPRRVISIGRLLHWKGFDLGIEAFAGIVQEFPDAEYWIVGDGPERRRLQRMIDQRELQGKVRLAGRRPRDLVMNDLAECDVLLHPSMHDSGGWVTLEAMAAARPVVCLDAGGPALQVDESNGFKIQPGERGQVVHELANALRLLLANDDVRERMGVEARSHVHRNFHFTAIGRRIRGVYEEILGIPDSVKATAPINQPT